MSDNFLNSLQNISTFILDVDGVLTDGSVLATDSGEQFRTFNIKDGYALQLAVKKGYRVVIITGARSPGVVKRLQGLGITDIFSGISEKTKQFQEYVAQHQLQQKEILAMGDDVPDYAILKQSAVACCPHDAVADIRDICHYVSPVAGGRGCVRDVIEKVMKIQGKWSVQDTQNLVW